MDDLAEGVCGYTKQQWGQSISLVDTTLDSQLCNWLGISLQSCLPQSHFILDGDSSYPVDVVEFQAFQYSCL